MEMFCGVHRTSLLQQVLNYAAKKVLQDLALTVETDEHDSTQIAKPGTRLAWT
jgi:hypothetical protein